MATKKVTKKKPNELAAIKRKHRRLSKNYRDLAVAITNLDKRVRVLEGDLRS
jgi:predicted  nucleic acid-binding Zn-ribbon protein